MFSCDTDRYETWELHCSKNEFQLKLEFRSKPGVRWWGITKWSSLEYIHEAKGRQFSFVSKKNFLLPQMPTPFPVAFRHLSSALNQNCLLYLTSNELCIILPRSAVEMKVKYIVDSKRFYGSELFKFAVLDRDLLESLGTDSRRRIRFCDRYSETD